LQLRQGLRVISRAMMTGHRGIFDDGHRRIGLSNHLFGERARFQEVDPLCKSLLRKSLGHERANRGRRYQKQQVGPEAPPQSLRNLQHLKILKKQTETKKEK